MPNMDSNVSLDSEDTEDNDNSSNIKNTKDNGSCAVKSGDIIKNGIRDKYANSDSHPLSSTDQSLSASSPSDSEEVRTPPIPPDGGWGWVVVFASFMINLISDGVSLSFGILFVDLVEYFGESKGKTAWVGSIFLSMPLLTGPIASYLTDRYGCRKVSIYGALLASGGFIISVFAHSLEMLFLTFTIAGFGLALCYVTSIVIVAYYFEKKRSLATGLAVCGTGIGTFVFAPLTIYLLEHYAWRGTLLILAGFFLNIVAFGALMRDFDNPSKSVTDVSESSPRSANNSFNEGNTLEESGERLCSSLVQLPTYLYDNLPLEVITELSNKEGGYLNSLLEQYPNLLNSIVVCHGKECTMTVKSTPPIQQFDSVVKLSNEDVSKSKTTVELSKQYDKQSFNQRRKSCTWTQKPDSAYLCNMRLQRGSITYRGAMLNIRRYRLRASSCPDIYRNSMVTIIENEKKCPFFGGLKEVLIDMIDLSIFKNIQYSLFCLSNFLLYACVDVPYVYIPDNAFNNGVDMESASFLISILGFLNTCGVIMVGYVGDKTWIDSSLLYSGFIAISGIVVGIVPWVPDYYGQATIVAIYGFTVSANYTLVSVIIVDLISLDSFTGAYGLLLLVQGVANLIGPPLAGWLYDVTGSYDVTFYATGICMFLSGALVIPVAKTNFCSSSKSTIHNSKESLHQSHRIERVHFKENSKEGFQRENVISTPSPDTPLVSDYLTNIHCDSSIIKNVNPDQNENNTLLCNGSVFDKVKNEHHSITVEKVLEENCLA